MRLGGHYAHLFRCRRAATGERGSGVPADVTAILSALRPTRSAGSAARPGSASIFCRSRCTSCFRSWRSPLPRRPQTWVSSRSVLTTLPAFASRICMQPRLELGQPHRSPRRRPAAWCASRSSTSGPAVIGAACLEARAAQQRLDAREQRARAERLGQVVVGAEVERPHQVLFLAAHGQHHHRDAATARGSPRRRRSRCRPGRLMSRIARSGASAAKTLQSRTARRTPSPPGSRPACSAKATSASRSGSSSTTRIFMRRLPQRAA